LVDEGSLAETLGCDYDEPSCQDMADIDSIISDNVVFIHYEGVEFYMDDFFCTAGKEGIA
jgi:hypothetical protein